LTGRLCRRGASGGCGGLGSIGGARPQRMQPRSLAIRARHWWWLAVRLPRARARGTNTPLRRVPRMTDTMAVQVSRSSIRVPNAESSSSTAPSADRSSSSTRHGPGRPQRVGVGLSRRWSGRSGRRRGAASRCWCLRGRCGPSGWPRHRVARPRRSGRGSRRGGTCRWGFPTVTGSVWRAGLRRCRRGPRAGTDRPTVVSNRRSSAGSTVCAIVTTWDSTVETGDPRGFGGDHRDMRGRDVPGGERGSHPGRCCRALPRAPSPTRPPDSPRWRPRPASRSSRHPTPSNRRTHQRSQRVR
jgi:hypothetical protein